MMGTFPDPALGPGASGWNHCHAEVNGIRMHYVRAGSGPPLMLLHGWPEFWWTWHRNLPVLARQFEIIVPDLRGFGLTDKPAGSATDSYTVHHHAADIGALADVLGLERFGVVSHDVGAWAIQRYAHRNPARLAGLFFTNCPYAGIGQRWAAAEHIREIWYQSFNQQPFAAELVGRDRHTCALYIGGMLAHWAHDPHAFDDQLDFWVDNFMQPGNLQGGFNWYIAQHAERMALVRGDPQPVPVIDVPARFLWGASDPVLRAAWSDRLGEYFSDIELDIQPAAGHFVHFEQATALNEAVARFFAPRF